MNRVEEANVLNPKASLGVVPERIPSGSSGSQGSPSFMELPGATHHSDPSLQLADLPFSFFLFVRLAALPLRK